MFWKKSDKSKAEGKKNQQPKAKACGLCDNLRRQVKGLRSRLLKVSQRRERIDGFFNSVQMLKEEYTEIHEAQQMMIKRSRLRRESQVECLNTAFSQLNQEQSEKIKALQMATDEVATCFNSYKTTTEEARKDERKNMMMMREEIVAMKQQLLDEIQQLEYQVVQERESNVWMLSMQPNQPAFSKVPSMLPYSNPTMLQADHNFSGQSYMYSCAAPGPPFAEYKLF